MKREIKVRNYMGSDCTGTLIIDKGGLRIVNKNHESISDNLFIRNFITDCINMDYWQHSLHIDIKKAQFKGSEERVKIRKILNDKIKQRNEEIQMLKDALHILGRWGFKYE